MEMEIMEVREEKSVKQIVLGMEGKRKLIFY